jgi:hypothetical protein
LRTSRCESGSSDQRLGEEQPLLLAPRQPAERPARVIGRADRVNRRHRDSFGLRATCNPHTPAVAVDSETDKVKAAEGQVGIEARALRDVSDLWIATVRWLAEHLECARGGR